MDLKEIKKELFNAFEIGSEKNVLNWLKNYDSDQSPISYSQLSDIINNKMNGQYPIDLAIENNMPDVFKHLYTIVLPSKFENDTEKTCVERIAIKAFGLKKQDKEKWKKILNHLIENNAYGPEKIIDITKRDLLNQNIAMILLANELPDVFIVLYQQPWFNKIINFSDISFEGNNILHYIAPLISVNNPGLDDIFIDIAMKENFLGSMNKDKKYPMDYLSKDANSLKESIPESKRRYSKKEIFLNTKTMNVEEVSPETEKRSKNLKAMGF